MSVSNSSDTQKIFINDKEYRCPKCSLIPFFNIFTKENKLFMSIKCTNDHNYSKTFDEMENIIKTFPISNYSCVSCKIENNKKFSNVYYYCSVCFKFFCFNHGEAHNLKENHKLFLSKNFDSCCIEHNGNTVVGYCKNHNKNYCFRCGCFEENNKKFEDDLKDDKIYYYENKIKENENIIKDIELLFKNYKKLLNDLENNFNNFKENINKRIKFMYEIIDFYKKKKLKII